TVERVLVVELDDRLTLRDLQPVVARDLAVVLVGLAVALAPLVELAFGDVGPLQQLRHGDLGLLGPLGQVVDDGIARIGGHPALPPWAPRVFFSARCSSEMSAITESFLASLASSSAICRSLRASSPSRAARARWPPCRPPKRAARLSATCLCQPWKTLGWMPYSSQRSETATLSTMCRRTISAFCSGVNLRRLDEGLR